MNLTNFTPKTFIIYFILLFAPAFIIPAILDKILAYKEKKAADKDES